VALGVWINFEVGCEKIGVQGGALRLNVYISNVKEK
jgi:hypothetical protein